MIFKMSGSNSEDMFVTEISDDDPDLEHFRSPGERQLLLLKMHKTWVGKKCLWHKPAAVTSSRGLKTGNRSGQK